MKFVSFYEITPGALGRIMDFFPAHRARLEEFHSKGLLIAAGPLGNPPSSAMGIFPSKEAAEDFVKGDPFVLNGLVSTWRIVEWKAAFL